MVLNSVLYNGVEYERQKGLLVGIGVSTAVNGSGSLRQENAKSGTDEDIAVVYSKGGGSGNEFYGKVVYTPPNTYFGYKIGGWTSIAGSGSMSLSISGSNATRNSGGLGSILGNGSGSLPSGCVTLYRSDISWNGYYTPKVASGGSITLKGNSEASRKESSSASITPGYSDSFVWGDRGYSGGISASVSPVRTGGCYTPKISGGASSTPKPSGSKTPTEVKKITSNMNAAIKRLEPSDAIVEFIKIYEYKGEYSKFAYSDKDGVWTIGYGHVLRGKELEEYVDLKTHKPKKAIIEEKAKEFLKNDIKAAADAINEFMEENKIQLSQNQFDALVSFTFNVGSAWTKNKSSETRNDIIKAVKSGIDSNLERKLRDDFLSWTKVQGEVWEGLQRRRYDEWEMFVKGDYKVIGVDAWRKIKKEISL